MFIANTIPAVRESIPMPTKRATRDVSIDYLRALITVSIIAVHCSLGYSHVIELSPGRGWNSMVPIVDARSSHFFDYTFTFTDLFFMALMFFISALFAYPSLHRQGAWHFLKDRLVRLGLPFLVTVTLIMPLGYFAAWQPSHPGGTYGSFWWSLVKTHFPVGPPWFLWILLVFDCMMALAFVFFGRLIPRLAPWLRRLEDAPGRSALGLAILCVALYLPLQHRYGYGYESWSRISPLFVLQPARMGIYVVWCLAGFLVGTIGIQTGLLAPSGRLVRGWRTWLVLAFVAYNALWFVPQMAYVQHLSLRVQHILRGVLWALGVSATTFAAIALFRAKCCTRHAWMDSLSRCAYVLILVHYVFVLWLQRLLLPFPLTIALKFTICFLVSTVLSWLIALILIRTPGLRRII
jgi:glucan biosynthesis protein C